MSKDDYGRTVISKLHTHHLIKDPEDVRQYDRDDDVPYQIKHCLSAWMFRSSQGIPLEPNDHQTDQSEDPNPIKCDPRDPGLRESDSQNMSKERVDREEHDQQVGDYPIKYIFFNHDATHIDNVDGLKKVKLDIKDSVEALPQSPVEAESGDAIAEQNRVQELASLGYSPGQQHARETENGVEQACQHGHRFFDGTNR